MAWIASPGKERRVRKDIDGFLSDRRARSTVEKLARKIDFFIREIRANP
jgi:hypothetical protein